MFEFVQYLYALQTTNNIIKLKIMFTNKWITNTSFDKNNIPLQIVMKVTSHN